MIVAVYILSVASLVCDVMVLIPLFKKEGVLKGILAVICGLYSFIWGWMVSSQKSGASEGCPCMSSRAAF